MKTNVEDFRIFQYVDAFYDDQPIHLIDFKRHLKPPSTLNKVVTKAKDGRPIHATYYMGADTSESNCLARIHFLFQNLTDSPMMGRRAEVLCYIDNNGEEGPDIYIKDKIFNPYDQHDLMLMIEERVNARKSIVASLKGSLVGAIQAHTGQSTFDVALDVSLFWGDLSESRDAFVELGTDTFRDTIVAIDLGTTVHSWLSLEIAAGVTIQMYLADTLTYVTSDAHGDKTFIV